MGTNLKATKRHLPYGIALCYLPPTQVNTPHLTPIKQASTNSPIPGTSIERNRPEELIIYQDV